MSDEPVATPLRRSQLDPDPIEQFRRWFADATRVQPRLPEGSILSTVDPAGQPSARTVLLKSFDESGFVFFTNYRSRKAVDLETNARACLLFWWPGLERQVRIEGMVSMVSSRDSDLYFETRPRRSQMAAWASEQSRIVESRDLLDHRMRELEAEYGDERPIPRPPHWGGYLIEPHRLEFWQGQPDRLHDRFLYEKSVSEPGWSIHRLAP